MKIYLAAPGRIGHLKPKTNFLFSYWDIINTIPFRKITMAALGFKHENLCRYISPCEGSETSS